MAFSANIIHGLRDAGNNKSESELRTLAAVAVNAVRAEFPDARIQVRDPQINNTPEERKQIASQLAKFLKVVGDNMNVHNVGTPSEKDEAKKTLIGDVGFTNQLSDQLNRYMNPGPKPVDPFDPTSGIDPQAFQKKAIRLLEEILAKVS